MSEDRQRTRLPAAAAPAAAGLIAAVGGVSTGHLLAALVSPTSSPVLAVSGVLIDATPTPVKEWAVQTFGTWSKTVLTGSTALVLAALAAAIGVLGRRRPRAAVAGLVGLGVVAAVAALARPAAIPMDAVPSLAAALVSGLSLRWLLRLAGEPSSTTSPAAAGPPAAAPHTSAAAAPLPAPSDAPSHESPLDHSVWHVGAPATADRRRFLYAAGGLTLGSIAVGSAGQVLATRTAQPTIALPRPQAPLPPLPTGLEGGVSGLTPLRTPVSEFYRIDTALVIPRVDAGSWRLTIDGMVDREVSWSYADILAMDLIEADVTINCVSNETGGPYIGSTRWLGVPVRSLMAQAGPQAAADQVLSTSVDGMTISTPIEALTDDRGALLAVAMDGAPLPARHGFPARLITPGLYGFVGATKWVERLTVTTYAAQQAYWTVRGWATDSPVQTQARIDTPRPGSTVDAGSVAIAGVAWSQAEGGITAVEVQVDGGEWKPARLGPEVGRAYWRQWVLPWEASSGRHTVAVRATNGDGEVQTTAVAAPFPSGATGLHRVEITVR